MSPCFQTSQMSPQEEASHSEEMQDTKSWAGRSAGFPLPPQKQRRLTRPPALCPGGGLRSSKDVKRRSSGCLAQWPLSGLMIPLVRKLGFHYQLNPLFLLQIFSCAHLLSRWRRDETLFVQESSKAWRLSCRFSPLCLLPSRRVQHTFSPSSNALFSCPFISLIIFSERFQRLHSLRDKHSHQRRKCELKD